MGSLVWTTPESLRFQINRVDVYANNSYTNKLLRTPQRLLRRVRLRGYRLWQGGVSRVLWLCAEGSALHDGLLTVGGASILAWPMQDVRRSK